MKKQAETMYAVTFKRRNSGKLKTVEVLAKSQKDASKIALSYLLDRGYTVGPKGWREYGISLALVVCRYDDCPNAATSKVTPEDDCETGITCPICRRDLGLPALDVESVLR
jgi:hypothetical protein